MFIKEILKKITPLTVVYHGVKRAYYSLLTYISPELNTRVRYRAVFGKKLNLDAPQTLNEKLLWLKLKDYETNTLVRQCADKYTVRDYVREMGCEEIIVPLIATYDSVDEINWDELPDSFAMKWNFGCGFNIICRNKADLDIPAAIKKMKKWGRTQYHLLYSEMQYKDVPKKIIVEQYLSDGENALPTDYKVYCFNGKAEYLLVCIGREKGHPNFYFFNRNWELCRLNKDSKAAPEGFTVDKPLCIDKIFDYAQKLSTPFPFVRADFYAIGEKVYFGELTFTPAGGLDVGRLPETDRYFGSLIDLKK